MKNTRDIVKDVLETEARARSDDAYLYYNVARKIVPDIGVKSFLTVMYSIKSLGLPPFETVRRYRQRLQSIYPELAADGNTEAARELEQEKYVKIARMNA